MQGAGRAARGQGWVLTALLGSLITPGQSVPSLGLHLTAMPRELVGGASPILPGAPDHGGIAKARHRADRGARNHDDDGDTLSFIKLSVCSRHHIFFSLINSAGQVLLLSPWNR